MHLIGRLQTNKVKFAIKIFDYIHSLDNQKLADILSKSQNEINKSINYFIQVNIGNESQKSGIHYNEVLENHRLGFPLVHSEANFHHPLSYGDTATCKLKIKRIGNTSITWDFEIFNQDEILCWTSVQTTVCTSMDEITKKVSVPEWMREGLSKIQE